MTKLPFNIFSTKIPIKFNRQEFCAAIVKDHKNLLSQNFYTITQGANFELNNKYNNFVNYLYNIFLSECENLFGKLKLLNTNKQVGWAYVTNKKEYISSIHNHINTSIINGVYYLNVPSNKSGAIEFYSNNEIYIHQPINDELLIFPNYLLHKPLMSNTEDYRIAINLEIICNNVWL